jgi:hypothetical protein
MSKISQVCNNNNIYFLPNLFLLKSDKICWKKKLHISIKIGQYKMKKNSSKILCKGYYIGMGGDVGKSPLPSTENADASTPSCLAKAYL